VNGVADPFGGYETVSTRVDGLSTAGKPGTRSARASESETGAIDERRLSRERSAIEVHREARYSRYARYKRTLRSGEGSLLAVYEIRARERGAAQSNARVKMQREAMHGVEIEVRSKEDDSQSGNTTKFMARCSEYPHPSHRAVTAWRFESRTLRS
jgi:hypothetical protein